MKIRPEIEEKCANLLNLCRDVGLRRTNLLNKILQFFTKSNGPVSMLDLLNESSIDEICDQTTVYRLISRLENKGIVRRIGMHARSAHYILNQLEDHQDYLICVDCGVVKILEMACPISELEQTVSKKSGFKNLYHELQFYGICSKCSKKK